MKPLLLIAHPGHELRIFEWVRRSRPHVVVLTHGDGSIGQPRLADTEHLLEQINVQVRTDWLQPVSDASVYKALLEGDVSLWHGWLAQLARVTTVEHIDCIVADQAEGYNPSHDLCRAMANCLVQELRHAGKSVTSLEFPLIGHSCDPTRQHDVGVEVTLSHDELQHKLAIMRNYAKQTSPVLERELQTMLDTFGEDSFAKECLYPAAQTPYESNELPSAMPEFERIGEERFRTGVYQHVIRAEHLRRLVQDMLHRG
ncbi:hypothetical protein G7048_05005 [Diaphorobacter sp. HDW4B]|uniref:hypothetical protein n=1 Tax=Diaphorobacter sp. HDW4B TaxID=2714925 RepID=UPI00140C3DB0|nr:hypothetical protein [Diaphorobacter sp. HDW4B]QIL69778.1 hypothetical protein G7048_05005 [Diaphorobacter sp. HDW4B]